MWSEQEGGGDADSVFDRIRRHDAYLTMLRSALDQTNVVPSNEILRGILWIDAAEGNAPDLLRQRGIRAVVSLGKRKAWYPEHTGITYHRVVIEDDATSDILKELRPACDFIHAHISADRAVLVHCEAGISRSATVCIAYLIREHHLSLVAAYSVVKAAREIICPNPGFLKQLVEWERSPSKWHE